MPLDPQAEAYLRQIAASGLRPLHEMTPEEARAAVAPAPQPVEAVGSIENRGIPGPGGQIPIRIYQPLRRDEQADGTPVIVYFHGGGWVQGSLDTHDGICRSLANVGECPVVAVEYRLAPEHKYPAAAEDALAATVWATEYAARLCADWRRVVVAGDSAGGNLAAVVCLMARDRGAPMPAGQVLLYPITDAACDTGTYREFADGYFLTAAGMRWFWNHYLNVADEGRQTYASPLRADDLRGLPPALVLTAEYDVLRDEGEHYAARLREAGVPVELWRYPGMIHGFLRRPDAFDSARPVLHEIARRTRAMLQHTRTA